MNPNQKTTRLLLLGVLVYLSLFSGLGSYDLSAPDEPRFALVAHEMLRDNHWLLPHRNERAYPDKPPLFFWSIAATSLFNGGEVNAWTARLPSALAAVWVLWVMWGFARERDDDDASGMLMVLVLLASFRFFFQAHMAQIDMLLCGLTTAALALGFRLMSGHPGSARNLGILLGLGILAKGPVGYLVPAGALLVFGLFQGRETLRRYPRSALLWGLVPPLIWLSGLLIEVGLRGEWGYLHNLLFKQTVVRYLNPWHHYKPFWYFLEVILYDFLPWVFLLLAAIPWRRAARASLSSKQRFAWAVVIFTLFFFSLSKGKRNLYILPMYPFAAYLVWVRLRQLMAMPRPGWRLGLPFAIPLLVFLIVGLAFSALGLGALDAKLPEWLEGSTPPGPPFLVAGLALVVMAVTLAYSLIKSRARLAAGAVVCAMILINLALYQVALPWVSPHRSARVFTEQATAIIEQNDPSPTVAMVGYRSAYRLYGKFPLVELADDSGYPPADMDLNAFWDQFPEGWVIVRNKDWEPYREKHEAAVTEYLSTVVGRGQKMLLLKRH